MATRDDILARIRRSLAVPADDSQRSATIAKRMADAPRGIIPARGQLGHAEQIELFETMAIKAAASVVRVAAINDVPKAVADYLKSKNLPADIRMGDDLLLASAGWDKHPQLEVRKGASDGHDMSGLSHAFAGIAETATLYLTSGPDNPTTLNFLPEHHIVVLEASAIVGDMEEALGLLRAREGKGQMPRALNMITGPSRSGDIEQIILMGAHGPRALHIVIVG